MSVTGSHLLGAEPGGRPLVLRVEGSDRGLSPGPLHPFSEHKQSFHSVGVKPVCDQDNGKYASCGRGLLAGSFCLIMKLLPVNLFRAK